MTTKTKRFLLIALLLNAAFLAFVYDGALNCRYGGLFWELREPLGMRVMQINGGLTPYIPPERQPKSFLDQMRHFMGFNQ